MELITKINAQGFDNPVWKSHGFPTPAPFIGYESTLVDYLQWFVGIFWVITVGMVIWAAFLYLTAGENEEKVSEAKKRLTYAVIAGAIALLSTGIDLIVYYLLRGSSV